jgi:hypothetical protein
MLDRRVQIVVDEIAANRRRLEQIRTEPEYYPARSWQNEAPVPDSAFLEEHAW